MKKIWAFILLSLTLTGWADNSLPPLRERSLLKYYTGPYDGTKIMGFGYICSRAGEGLRIVRNEIVAKYGRPFKSLDVREYYEKTDWYAANPAYHDGFLSTVDNENIRRVQAVENGVKGSFRLLDDLRAGKAVKAEGGKITVAYDASSSRFRLTVNDGAAGNSYALMIPDDIDEADGLAADLESFLFTHNGLTYLAAAIHGGMHGEITNYIAVGFRYNPSTRFLSNIVIDQFDRY